MEMLKGISLDLKEENLNRLKEIFPEVFEEGKIDFEKLRLLLGDNVEEKEERYEFTWNGKRDAIRIAQTPSTGTLRPDKESSKNWDDTENLYIEGDNLEVLKLLQKSYFGKVKMIYIDPPYNTGKDFVYKDNFKDNIANYKEITSQTTKANPETNGRYHTDWLNMMYSRLKICRNLLSNDGIIFLSIDDNEVHNLIKICEEIFGQENFIGNFTWIKKKKGSHLSKTVRNMTEYVLAYSKNSSIIELFGESAYTDKWQPLAKRTNSHKILSFKENVLETTLKEGKYKSGLYGEGTSAIKFNNDFYVENGKIVNSLDVYGPFVWVQKKLDEELGMGTRVSVSSKWGFNALRSNQTDKVKRPTTILDNKLNIGTNEDAYEEAMDIFGQENIMSYPKPTSLIKYLINTLGYYDKDFIVLDFFSGSATTAHSTLQLNLDDNGNRKFIMVQLPEKTDEKSEAYKAGYKNICEIGKERIRRAGDKIVSENKDKEGIENLDIGFKVFKLDSSNLKSWDSSIDDLENNLLSMETNLKKDRSNEDLLYEILLKTGIELTAKIEEIKVGYNTIYNIGCGALLVCLDDKITQDVIDEIPKHKSPYMETKVIFKEAGFMSDAAKINAIQNLKQFQIEDVRSV